MEQVTKNYYKQYIAEHNLDDLIEKLLSQINEFLASKSDSKIQETYDSLILLAGKLKGVKQQKRLNILDNEEIDIEFSKVNNAVLELINELPDAYFDLLNDDKKSPEPIKTSLRKQVVCYHENTDFEYDAFFSFSDKDREEAQAIVNELRGYGLHVFLSSEALKLNVGSSFFEKIDHALKNSQHFILYSTESSMSSDWVKTEYETFFTEFYMKNKEIRKFILLKGKDFEKAEVPGLLKTLQFYFQIKTLLE